MCVHRIVRGVRCAHWRWLKMCTRPFHSKSHSGRKCTIGLHGSPFGPHLRQACHWYISKGHLPSPSRFRVVLISLLPKRAQRAGDLLLPSEKLRAGARSFLERFTPNSRGGQLQSFPAAAALKDHHGHHRSTKYGRGGRHARPKSYAVQGGVEEQEWHRQRCERCCKAWRWRRRLGYVPVSIGARVLACRSSVENGGVIVLPV